MTTTWKKQCPFPNLTHQLMLPEQGHCYNPIYILTDQQQKYHKQKTIEQTYNKMLINEAIMTNSKAQICFAVIKTVIPGSAEQKDRVLAQAIIQYYYQAISINISSQCFVPRIQADYSNPNTKPNPCAFILYGVDFLTTKEIISMFSTTYEKKNSSQNVGEQRDQYKDIIIVKVSKIIWINDSSCKLIFMSPQEAKIALLSQLKQGNNINVDNEDEVSKQWFMMKPYLLYYFKRPLIMRYATQQEENIAKANANCFKLFERAQGQICTVMLRHFRAEKKYLQIINQIQFRKYLECEKQRQVREPRVRSREQSQTRKFMNNSQSVGKKKEMDKQKMIQLDKQLSKYKQNKGNDSLNQSVNLSVNINRSIIAQLSKQRRSNDQINLSFQIKNDKKQQNNNLSFSCLEEEAEGTKRQVNQNQMVQQSNYINNDANVPAQQYERILDQIYQDEVIQKKIEPSIHESLNLRDQLSIIKPNKQISKPQESTTILQLFKPAPTPENTDNKYIKQTKDKQDQRQRETYFLYANQQSTNKSNAPKQTVRHQSYDGIILQLGPNRNQQRQKQFQQIVSPTTTKLYQPSKKDHNLMNETSNNRETNYKEQRKQEIFPYKKRQESFAKQGIQESNIQSHQNQSKDHKLKTDAANTSNYYQNNQYQRQGNKQQSARLNSNKQERNSYSSNKPQQQKYPSSYNQKKGVNNNSKPANKNQIESDVQSY